METAKDLFATLVTGRSYFTCEVCGNEYDKAFEVRMDGIAHVFDSFECAIEALAPRCANCGSRIIGHGLESDGLYYCCSHCAKERSVFSLEDRPMPDGRFQ